VQERALAERDSLQVVREQLLGKERQLDQR
jgi:hypothetical protein